MKDSIQFRSAALPDAKMIAELYYGLSISLDKLRPWEDRINNQDTWSVVAVQHGEIIGYIISFPGPDADGNEPIPGERIRILKASEDDEELLRVLLEKGIEKAKSLGHKDLEIWVSEDEWQQDKELLVAVLTSHGFKLTEDTRIVEGWPKQRYFKKL